MARMLRIEACGKCPMGWLVGGELEYRCEHPENPDPGTVISDEVADNGFPDWCPLPVAEQEDEHEAE